MDDTIFRWKLLFVEFHSIKTSSVNERFSLMFEKTGDINASSHQSSFRPEFDETNATYAAKLIPRVSMLKSKKKKKIIREVTIPKKFPPKG